MRPRRLAAPISSVQQSRRPPGRRCPGAPHCVAAPYPAAALAKGNNSHSRLIPTKLPFDIDMQPSSGDGSWRLESSADLPWKDQIMYTKIRVARLTGRRDKPGLVLKPSHKGRTRSDIPSPKGEGFQAVSPSVEHLWLFVLVVALSCVANSILSHSEAEQF